MTTDRGSPERHRDAGPDPHELLDRARQERRAQAADAIAEVRRAHVGGEHCDQQQREADRSEIVRERNEQADRPCALLAYGDLKRVELAVALAGRPRLLLMDEPTAGMAPAERETLMRLAAALARDEGVAVLFTEHDMDVVFTHADRVIVLAGGELIAEGPPPVVRADARVREIYLGGADA